MVAVIDHDYETVTDQYYDASLKSSACEPIQPKWRGDLGNIPYSQVLLLSAADCGIRDVTINSQYLPDGRVELLSILYLADGGELMRRLKVMVTYSYADHVCQRWHDHGTQGSQYKALCILSVHRRHGSRL